MAGAGEVEVLGEVEADLGDDVAGGEREAGWARPTMAAAVARRR